MPGKVQAKVDLEGVGSKCKLPMLSKYKTDDINRMQSSSTSPLLTYLTGAQTHVRGDFTTLFQRREKIIHSKTLQQYVPPKPHCAKDS